MNTNALTFDQLGTINVELLDPDELLAIEGGALPAIPAAVYWLFAAGAGGFLVGVAVGAIAYGLSR